ncbi:putative mucin-associated surface protein (MASP) [Trypanosoma cruzi]|nr:putative mucin-associated surface protein (MASP) [Trypanosoma cruzi]
MVRCVAVWHVSLLLPSLRVDGELVCAEGCTQVTGVMAMMMTGRVLLVCALCVLWCGAAVGTEGDGSEEMADPSSERSQVLQNVLSEPTDGKKVWSKSPALWNRRRM